MDLLFIDTLIYRLLGRDFFFFLRGKTMPPSLVPEWIHLFSITSGSHLFRPATAAGSVCVGGLARPSPSSCPCPAPAGPGWVRAPGLWEGLGTKLLLASQKQLCSAWGEAMAQRCCSPLPGDAPWHLFHSLSSYCKSLMGPNQQQFN